MSTTQWNKLDAGVEIARYLRGTHTVLLIGRIPSIESALKIKGMLGSRYVLDTPRMI
jgi:hypothetical protein